MNDFLYKFFEYGDARDWLSFSSLFKEWSVLKIEMLIAFVFLVTRGLVCSQVYLTSVLSRFCSSESDPEQLQVLSKSHSV